VVIHLANGVGANNYLPLLPQLAIYDIHGRMVHASAKWDDNLFTWNPQGLPSGIYLVKIFSGDKTLVKRLYLQQ
jgi:hypothetical protein